MCKFYNSKAAFSNFLTVGHIFKLKLWGREKPISFRVIGIRVSSSEIIFDEICIP